MSLSTRPFPPGTLVRARPRSPFRGAPDVVFYDRVYCYRSHRRDSFDNARYESAAGFWTVLDHQRIRGMGWWHEIVRVTAQGTPDEQGWVEDIERDFIVVPSSDI